MSTSGRTPAECPVCGAPVHPRDRFCAACGADVVANGPASDSLLDELMPAAHDRTAELPPITPAEAPPTTAAPPPVQVPLPADVSPVPPTYGDAPPPRDDDAPRRGSLVLPVVLLVAVLLVAVLAWRFAFSGSDDPETASGSTTTSSQAAPSEEPSSAEPSPDEETPSPSPSESEEGPERITLASTAEQCGEVGGAAVYRGNDVTSCEFAREVAEALGASEVPTRLSARSPVTKRDYAMDCEDTAPVTCRGGNDALVYVNRD